MPKYINADAFADRLEALAYDDWNQGASTTWANALEDFAEMVRDEIAVDVESVRYGHWIDDKIAFYRKCSECGAIVRANLDEVFLDCDLGDLHYCPNCGAKMENGERK